jgi:peptidoglycan/LPS O-acetylase OafA/YrhL
VRRGVSTDARDVLKPLTSLRFAAALMVFVHHVPPAHALAERLSFGYAGVGFFFVLSGFILTYAHHRDFAGALTWRGVRTFHVARIARIYPMHVVTTALALAWFIPFGAPQWDVSSASERIAGFTAQALLLQSWSADGNVYGAGNPVSWSISVEALFYALFPFALWLLIRTVARASARVLVAMVAIVCVAQYAVLWSVHVTPGITWLLYRFPIARLPDFAVGMLLGLAFVRRPRPEPRLSGTALDVTATPVSVAGVAAIAVSIAEVTAIAAVIAALAALPFLPEALRYAAGLMPFWALLIGVFALQRGAISRLASHPSCVRLGEISFAFYMVHWLVLNAESRLLGWTNPVLSLAIGFAVSLAAAFALFHLVETPMRHVIRRRFAPARDEAGAGWSGRRESNPRLLLGRQGHYHYATPALGLGLAYESSGACPGDTRRLLDLVGRGGFEPPYRFREPNLQSGAINHSTTDPKPLAGDPP